MEYLTSAGAAVFVPLFHSPDCDLIADYGDRLVRVQVKTVTYVRNRRFCVQLSTRGGNQSWSGLVKRFGVDRCDFLFVLATGGRRWFIPSSVVHGETRIALGGPKYAPFELEPTTDYLAVLDSGLDSGGASELESRARL